MSSNHFPFPIQSDSKSKSELNYANFNISKPNSNKNNLKKNKIIIYHGSALSHTKGKSIEAISQKNKSPLSVSDGSLKQGKQQTVPLKQPSLPQHNRINMHSQPTSTDVREYFRNISTPLPTLSFDEQFDELVENMDTHPLNEAFEKFTF